MVQHLPPIKPPVQEESGHARPLVGACACQHRSGKLLACLCAFFCAAAGPCMTGRLLGGIAVSFTLLLDAASSNPSMPSIHPSPPQGLVMTAIAWRFNFRREAAKALARAAARTSTAAGDSGLRQPLLEGPHCDRLEAGVLLDPAGLDEEEQLPAAQLQTSAGEDAAGAAAGTQRGRQREAAQGEEQASPKEEA